MPRPSSTPSSSDSLWVPRWPRAAAHTFPQKRLPPVDNLGVLGSRRRSTNDETRRQSWPPLQAAPTRRASITAIYPTSAHHRIETRSIRFDSARFCLPTPTPSVPPRTLRLPLALSDPESWEAASSYDEGSTPPPSLDSFDASRSGLLGRTGRAKLEARTGRGTIENQDDEEDQGWPILRSQATLLGRAHWSPASAVKHGLHPPPSATPLRGVPSTIKPDQTPGGSGKWASSEIFGMVLKPVRVLWAAPWEAKRRAFG